MNPCKIFLLLLLILSSDISYSQNRYIFFFRDKNNSPYSLSNPQQFLSSRAIARRTTYNIPLDSTDLPVNPAYVQGVAATGATILNVTKWFNGIVVETSNPSVIASIIALPYVKNFGVVGRPSSTDVISKYDRMEPLLPVTRYSLRTSTFNYGQGGNQVNMIGLEFLHNSGYTGENMLIAVIDAGFLQADVMTCFDSLFQQGGIVATYDFVDHETNVYNDHNHGTSVLSCMAANVPGDMVGTAPHAKYLLLRSEDSGSENKIEEYNWSVAAEYADSAGCDVINSSLGYSTFDDPSQNHTYADMDGNTCPAAIAADLAASKGILVTCSAGNEGNSPWNYLITPSDADSVMSVGAVDPFGAYASFSSNGPSSDGRVKPDVAAQGAQAILYSSWAGNSPVAGNGTSFSGPILAGAAACLWQSSPHHNNMEVIQVIKRSASQFSHPDTNIGYGIPNFALAKNLLGLGDITIPSDQGLHIFPNPALPGEQISFLYFSNSSGKIDAELFDAEGRLIDSFSKQTYGYGYSLFSFNPELSRGLYLLSVDGNNGKQTARFVIH